MEGTPRSRSFKMPPIENSQNSRRMRRLEEQKRSRAMKVESARNVDIFAGLSLNEMEMDEEAQPSERGKRPSKWANLAMYAEPLELNGMGDILPHDFGSAWIALAPIPRGKRCILVAHKAWSQGSVVSLRSRVKGNQFMTFRSRLPTDTVLDCILDENWQQNGILHVVDIIRWRSQDYTQCEASFRFWWRDVKLSELPLSPPPPSTSSRPPFFSYPHTLQPVPCFPNLQDINLLQSTVIPVARSGRSLDLPIARAEVPDASVLTTHYQSDGILFYVGESSYEPGSSLLAAWVPNLPLNPEDESPLEVFARHVQAISNTLVQT